MPFYNAGFEAWEARRAVSGRPLSMRIIHAIGFEGGLAFILVPVVAWWMGIGLIEALLLDLGLLVFFLVRRARRRRRADAATAASAQPVTFPPTATAPADEPATPPNEPNEPDAPADGPTTQREGDS